MSPDVERHWLYIKQRRQGTKLYIEYADNAVIHYIYLRET